MRSLLYGLALLVTSSALGAPQASANADNTAADAKAWFDQAWAKAARMPDLGDRQITWVLTEYPAARTPLSEEQADAQSSMPRAKNGSSPSISVWTILSQGDGAWRYNLSWPASSLFVDTINTEQATWALSPGSLRIFDPKLRATDDLDQGVERRISSFYINLSNHVSGGFGAGLISKMTPTSFEMVSDDRWVSRASRMVSGNATFVVEFSGEWIASGHRGRVLMRKVIENTYVPGHAGATTKYADYTYDEPSALDICRHVEERDNAGRLLRVSESIGLTALPVGGFTLATAIPKGHDPLRGDLPAGETTDFVKRIIVDDKTGNSASISPRPAVTTPDDGERGFYRTLGYVLLGCIVIALVVLRLSKK